MGILHLGVSLLLAATVTASSAEPVSFQRDIAPILHRRCATCHNEENAKGKYRVDTFTHLQKPGDSELSPVTPGEPESSEVYQLLLEASPEDRMPQKADPLPEPEISLIKRWLDEGARYDGDAPDRPIAELARATLLQVSPELYPRPVGITAIAFSPDGTKLATSGYFEVLLWDRSGQLLRRIGGMPQQITSLAWDKASNLIAVAGGTPGQWGTVMLVNVEREYATNVLMDLPEVALSVGSQPHSTALAVGSGDRTIRFFDFSTSEETRVLRQHSDWVQAITFSDDGSRLLSVSRDRTARVINTASGELEGTFTNHQTAVTAGAFLSGDGSRALSIDLGTVLFEWDGRTGARRSTNPGLHGSPTQVLVRNRVIFIAGGAPEITVYQREDRQALQTLLGHHDDVQTLAFSPDGVTLASGSADGEILLWDLHCGTWTHRFTASPVARQTERLTSTQ